MSRLLTTNKNRNVAIGAAIAGLLVVVVLSNQPAKTPEGQLLVTTSDSYNATLQKVNDLIASPFDKDRAGVSLDDTDLRKLREASPLIDSLGRYHPTNIVTFVYAGKIYQLLGDAEVAEARFKQALANEKNDLSQAGVDSVIEAKAAYSQLLVLSGKYAEAFKLADAAVKGHPESPSYLAARASAEVQLKDLAAANRDLDAALKLQPDFVRALRLKKLLSPATNTQR